MKAHLTAPEVIRPILNVHPFYFLSQIEMYTLASEMVYSDDLEILFSRITLAIPHLCCSATISLEALASVSSSLSKLILRNSDLPTIVTSFCGSEELEFSPKIGVPVQIPKNSKAHGCQHACNVLRKLTKTCYVETKYDGQRMQIHVDLTRPYDSQVQIFSKDRNDSTKARAEIIP